MEPKTERKKSSIVWCTIALVATLVILGAYRHNVIAGEQPADGSHKPTANGAPVVQHQVPVLHVVQSGEIVLSTTAWSTSLEVKPWQGLEDDIYGEFIPNKDGYFALIRDAANTNNVHGMRLGEDLTFTSLDMQRPQWIIVGRIVTGSALLRFSKSETNMVDVASSSL